MCADDQKKIAELEARLDELTQEYSYAQSSIAAAQAILCGGDIPSSEVSTAAKTAVLDSVVQKTPDLGEKVVDSAKAMANEVRIQARPTPRAKTRFQPGKKAPFVVR